MIRIITTKYGQLLADVKVNEGITTIIDGKTFQPVARVRTVDKREVLKAINCLGAILNKQARLNKLGIELIDGATLIKTNVLVPKQQGPKTVVRKKELSEDAVAG